MSKPTYVFHLFYICETNINLSTRKQTTMEPNQQVISQIQFYSRQDKPIIHKKIDTKLTNALFVNK